MSCRNRRPIRSPAPGRLPSISRSRFATTPVVLNLAECVADRDERRRSCGGTFRFGYGRESREALIGLAPHQPDLTGKLASLLAAPDYPVAELTCGEGASTYVLLDERGLVAIYRDRDIAGIERLSRL